MAKDFKLNVLPSLNPYDFNHAGSTTEEGVPFFLAKTTPKKLKANDGTVFTPSYAQPSVFEEIAKVKQTTRKKGIEKMSDIKTPSAEELNKVLSMKGSATQEVPVEPSPMVSESSPMDQLKNDYMTFMQKRMARQNELDADYDQLKSQERPSGFATLDLTPAFAFVDQMTGSKLTPSYKAPTAAKEFDAKLKAAQELALANGDKLSGDQFAAMGFDEKNRQYDDNQNQENARLDKTLANQMAIAKINAEAKAKNPSLDPNFLLALDKFNFEKQKDFNNRVTDLGKELKPGAELQQTLKDARDAILANPDLPGLGWSKANPLQWISDDAIRDGGRTKRLVEKVAADYIKATSGTAASDKERQALEYISGRNLGVNKDSLLDAIDNLTRSWAAREASTNSGYPAAVVNEYKRNTTTRNPGPSSISSTPIGTIEDGYKFMGGDDKDSKNWVKVK